MLTNQECLKKYFNFPKGEGKNFKKGELNDTVKMGDRGNFGERDHIKERTIHHVNNFICI
jgi:hypothetical protein